MKKKQLILFCYHHGGDKTRFMTHLRPHTSCTDHFSHAPKIGTGKQSACQCVHQVLQEEIGSFGLFALQSAIFFIAVLFLMVSINICRVISTFITQGAFPFDVACYSLVVVPELNLPQCGHDSPQSCRVVTVLMDSDEMLGKRPRWVWLNFGLIGQPKKSCRTNQRHPGLNRAKVWLCSYFQTRTELHIFLNFSGGSVCENSNVGVSSSDVFQKFAG